MSKLKNKKYFALLGIVLLVVGIIGLFVYGKVDKYKGLVKVKNVVSNTTVLSASISNTVDQPNTSKGSDEIKYELKYTLDQVTGVDTRDVIIKGRLSDSEGKYARFKNIKGSNITSTITNDGKEIEVEVKDVPLGIENKITLKLIITNAPNGFRVNPNITIKEKTSDEVTTITTNEVEVSTTMIRGKVLDEKDTPVGNIELSLNDSNGEIRRTYTDENGNYLFSDVENGNYTIEIEEEIYQGVGNNRIDGSGELNIKVKEVKPYEIEGHKYITDLHLVVNGKPEDYKYPDLEKVVQTVKNAKTISGEIVYKITVKNIGEKTGKLSMLKDKVDDGLSFDKNKNAGWIEKDGDLYYEPINNVSIKQGETRTIGLVLDIKSTNQIKTYINQIDANGETYERVVYILNGRKYKEEEVILGEKIIEPTISESSFSGWYTDSNYTNKYNFNNPVTKDLILYGNTEVITHIVEFYDKNPSNNVETKWDEQEVEDGNTLTEPTDPSHTGYTFECWMDEHDTIWNFNNPVERDMKLTSCYTINRYSIVYKGLTDAEKTALNNPTSYTIEDTVNITDANDRYDDENFLTERFLGWTGSNGTTPSKGITFSHETGDKEYTANFEHIDLDAYLISYVLNGGELESGKTNPTSYTKKTPTFTLNNPSKPHYTFIGWTGSNGDTPQTTVTMVKGENEGDKEFVANYEPIMHNVTFNDKDPENPVPETVTQYGDIVPVIDGGTVNPPATNPEHTGYTCDKWSTKLDGNYETDAYDFSTEITDDLVLYTLCKKNSYVVTFMDGENQFARQDVLYKELAARPIPDPDHKSEHKIFLGWTLNDADYDFNTPVTQNITLYAKYELVEEPAVSHVPTEWTNQNVNVTVTNKGTEGKDYTGYTYKYRVENGQNQDYTGVFEIEENCDVYATAYKSGVASQEVKHEIRNIDKIKPTITSLDANQILKTSFTVNISGYDHESGLDQFKIYLDDQYITTVDYDGETTTQNTAYNFGNLTPGTHYKVKVVAYDIATNSSEAREIDVETTDEDIIVAQITHNDGVELAEYIPLSTLRKGIIYNQDGINCNTEQCTIQMLANVTETNDILDGQDITLDLNGYNITGARDYTFNNSGSFKVIDTAPFTVEAPETITDHIKGLQSTDASLVTDSTIDLNVRYVGSSPNNYIRFNGELWRIIGVMNNMKNSPDSDETETRLKIVRATSIGNYSWDSSASNVNNGYGVNEWSQADLMKLLNPGFEGESVGGSLYYNSNSGTCYNSYGNRTTSCNFTTTGLSSTAKNYIDSAVWYTGSNGNITATSNFTPINMYSSYERGSKTGKICSSGGYCNDNVPRTTTWTGIVGVISPSDFGFATSGTSCTGTMSSWSNACKNNDWLRSSQWTITPAGNSSYAHQSFYLNNGALNQTSAYTSYAVYPTVYLKPDILFKSGTGTQSDPFEIMDDAEYQNLVAATTNGIKNNTDTAIVNSGIFTLGNLEQGTADVSEYKPYILGTRYGVSNTNTFNFYDGKIKATTAIDGKVTDTPYPYNAIVNVVDEEEYQKQIAVLKIVTDPEARINSVYYSKVQKAVDDAKKGYYYDTFSQAEFFDSLIKATETGFYFNSTTGYYENPNSYSTVKSYFIMDLSGYQNDQELAIRTLKTSNYDSGTIIIRKNDASGEIVYQKNLSVTSDDVINKFVLEKDNRYYVEFSYSPASSSSNSGKVYIKDIRISDYTSSDLEIIDKVNLNTDYTTYSFEYDENEKVIKPNNANVPSSVAFSYMEIDLTSATEDKELIANATLYGYGNDSYGNIVVSEENNVLSSPTSNALLYIFAPYSLSQSYNVIGPRNVSKRLEKGKKYYVQFYYFRGSNTRNDPKDGLYINSLRVIPYVGDTSSQSIINQGVTPGEYGFTTENCINSSYGICASRTYNTPEYVHHTYFRIDLTDSTQDKILNYKTSTSYNANVDFYGIVTDSEEFPERDGSEFFSIKDNVKTDTYPTIEKGKVSYVHFVVKQSGYYTYINELTLTNGTSVDLSTMQTPGTYGFVKNTGSNSYYYPNNNASGTFAHSYLELDLRGDNAEKYIEFNVNASHSLRIVATESTEMPAVDVNSSGFTYNSDSTSYNGTANVQLIPNKKNYVHFISEDRSGSASSVSIYSGKILNGHVYNVKSELKTSGEFGFDTTDGSYPDVVVPSSAGRNEAADSYIKIDLKDATSDKLIRVNAYDYYSDLYMYLSNSKDNVSFEDLSGQNRDDMLIYKNYSNNSEYYYNDTVDTTNNFMNYDFVLTKGSTYYLHFGSRSTSTSYKLRLRSVISYDIDNISINTGSNAIANPVSSGQATRIDNSVITEDTDNSFRYIGKNPKNFIKFNNEYWRIVGVFETEDESGNTDRRIKIVRNSSIGNYSWDSSSTSVNGGYGVNEWSQADIMKVLNPGYGENKETVYDQATSTSVETEVNNSLYWNKEDGICINGSNNYIGSVSDVTTDTNCNFSSIGLSNDAKQFIATVKWPTTGITISPSSYNDTAYTILNQERQSDTSSFPNNCTSSGCDTVERKATWVGKVGLLSASDVYLASGDYQSYSSVTPRSACVNNLSNSSCVGYSNWINSYNYLWTMTPYWSGNPAVNQAVNMYSYGNYSTVSSTYMIRPALYLSEKTVISGGNGTSDNPYTITMGSTKNPKNNYGLDEDHDIDDPSTDVNYVSDDVSFDSDLLKSSRVYGFTYDSEGNYFINENKGRESSVATSYTTIDMTNETSNKTILINYDLSSKLSADYGFIHVMKDVYASVNYSTAPSNMFLFKDSGTKSGTIEYELEAGSIYFIQFGYLKTSSQEVTPEIRDDFRISVLNKDDNEYITEFTRYDGIAPRLNEEVDTVHILKDISMTKALDIIDLRDVILDLNGHVLTNTTAGYVIDNKGSLTIVDSKYDNHLATQAAEQVAVNEEYDQFKEDYNANALQEYNDAIAYNNAIRAEMEEYSTKYVKDDLATDLSAYNHGNQSNKWKDLVSNEMLDIHGTSWTEDEGLIVNSTNDYVEFTKPYNGTFTYETTFKSMISASGYYERIFSISPVSVNGGTAYNSLIVGRLDSDGYVSVYYGSKYIRKPAQMNKIHTLSVTVNDNKLIIYLDGAKYEQNISDQPVMDQGNTTYRVGDVSAAKVAIYSARLYNKVLTEEAMLNNYEADSKTYNHEPIVEPELKDFDDYEEIIMEPRALGLSNGSTTGSTYNFPVNFDSKFKTLYVDLQAFYRNVGTGNLSIGLTPKSSSSYISSQTFKAMKEGEMPTVLKIKPDELGEYNLKIYITAPYVSNGTNSIAVFNGIRMVYEPLVLENTIEDHEGMVLGNTYHTIINYEGAKLNLEAGLVKNTYNQTAIMNFGELTIGENGIVNSNNIAVQNNGELKPSKGKIISDNYGISATTPTLIDGLYIEATNNGFSGNSATIKDSTIKSPTKSAVSATSIISIEKSNIDGDISSAYGNVTVTDSFVRGSIANSSDILIERSDIAGSNGVIRNEYTSSPDNRRNNITINDSYIYSALHYSTTPIQENSNLRINNSQIYSMKTASVDAIVSNSTFKDSITNTGNITVKDESDVNKITNEGILTLGDNSDVVSTEYPKVGSITSSSSAITGTNQSTFNFYDGQVSGGLRSAINSAVDAVPENYDLHSTKVSAYIETVTLKPINSTNEDYYVARIGDTYYTTLKGAIDAVNDNNEEETIDIIAPIYTVYQSAIPSTKTVKINMNLNPIISYIKNTAFVNDGVLTINEDEGGRNSSSNYFFSDSFIVNNNIMTTNNFGARDNNDRKDTNGPIIINNGTYSFNGGYLYSNTTKDEKVAIQNNENSSFTITGMRLYAQNGAGISNSGTLTIDPTMAYYYNTNVLLLNKEGATATIKGNDSSSSYAVNGLIVNHGTANISDLNGQNIHSIGYNDGTMTINNATFQTLSYYTDYTGSSTVISKTQPYMTGVTDHNNSYLENVGDLTIQDSTFIVIVNNSSKHGEMPIVYSSGDSTLSESGSTYSSNHAYNNLFVITDNTTASIDNTTFKNRPVIMNGTSKVTVDSMTLSNSTSLTISDSSEVTINNISVTNCDININGGTVSLLDGTVDNSDRTTGISVSAGATFTLGKKSDGVVSNQKPLVMGEDSGINITTGGIFNFYDGLVAGSKGIDGTITDIESGYSIKEVGHTLGEANYLDVTNVISNDTQHKVYTSVPVAFSEAVSGDTLTLIDSATTLLNDTGVVIPVDTEITFNLNGYDLSINHPNAITNNGIIHIRNDYELDNDHHQDGGRVYNYNGPFITNNGEIDLSGGTYDNYSGNAMFINQGTFTVDRGGIFQLRSGPTMIQNVGTLSIEGHGNASSNLTFNNQTANPMINNTDGADLTISGGLYNATSGSIINNEDSTVTITAGEYAVNSIRFGPTPDMLTSPYPYNISELIINKGSGYMDIQGGLFRNYLVINSSSPYFLQVDGSNTYNDNQHYTNYNHLKTFISNEDTATLSIKDAEFIGDSSPILHNASTTAVTMEDVTGSISGISYAIINEPNSSITMTGGNYIGSYQALLNKGTINASDIDKFWNIGANSKDSTFNLTDSEATGLFENYGTADITGSTISAITNMGQGKLDITNTTLDSYIGTIDDSETNLDKVTLNNNNANNTYGYLCYKTEYQSGRTIYYKHCGFSAQKGIYHSGDVLNIKESSITSQNSIGLEYTSGTITIGEQNNAANKDKILIKGSDYGIVYSGTDENKGTSLINFYDGTIEGANESDFELNSIETGFNFKVESGTPVKQYLDTNKIIKNNNTNVEYDNLQAAFNAASSGDVLSFIDNYYSTNTSSPITIASGKKFTVDLNGHKFKLARVTDYITNNGEITIKDSGSGSIEGVGTTYNFIVNNNKLTIDSGTYNNMKLVTNNGTMNVTNGTFNNNIIDNNGTITIADGTYTGTLNNTDASLSITTLTSTDLTINNNGSSSLTIDSGTYNTRFNLNNKDTSTTTINNGTFGGPENNIDGVINNEANATLTINDGNYYFKSISMSNNRPGGYTTTHGIKNSGTLNINDGVFDGLSGARDGAAMGPIILNYSTGTATVKDAEFGTTNYFGGVIYNEGTATFTNVTSGYRFFGTNEGTMTLDTVTITTTLDTMFNDNRSIITNFESGSLSIKSSTISSTATNENYSSNLNMLNLIGSGTATIEDSTLTGQYDNLINVEDAADITIKGNSNLSSLTGYGINGAGTYIANIYYDYSVITIGEKGNGVSVTEPSINGKLGGVNITNNYEQFNFYDGIISGGIPLQGKVNEIEPDYSIVSGEISGVKNVTLKLTADIERIAVVNNVNYTTLQAAINSCPSNGTTCEVTIYANITLSEPLTISENKVVSIILNGYTVSPENYVTEHEGTGTVSIVTGTPSGPGGAIYRFLADITGTEINPKDIIIYQMEDGSELESDVNYKLYKLIDGDYKIVKVKENEIGDYDLGNSTSILRTTTGEIKINGIGEGEYKLIGSSKELDFNINEHGISSNIRENKYRSKAKVTATAIATLILQLQTGFLRTPYMLIILLILLLIAVSYVYIQKKQRDYE